jgi:hypothetical protein
MRCRGIDLVTVVYSQLPFLINMSRTCPLLPLLGTSAEFPAISQFASRREGCGGGGACSLYVWCECPAASFGLARCPTAPAILATGSGSPGKPHVRETCSGWEVGGSSAFAFVLSPMGASPIIWFNMATFPMLRHCLAILSLQHRCNNSPP